MTTENYGVYREDTLMFTTSNKECAIEFCAESTISTGINYWFEKI